MEKYIELNGEKVKVMASESNIESDNGTLPSTGGPFTETPSDIFRASQAETQFPEGLNMVSVPSAFAIRLIKNKQWRLLQLELILKMAASLAPPTTGVRTSKRNRTTTKKYADHLAARESPADTEAIPENAEMDSVQAMRTRIAELEKQVHHFKTLYEEAEKQARFF